MAQVNVNTADGNDSNTLGMGAAGAVEGGVIGAVVGGPIGAVVGAGIGGVMGAIGAEAVDNGPDVEVVEAEQPVVVAQPSYPQGVAQTTTTTTRETTL